MVVSGEGVVWRLRWGGGELGGHGIWGYRERRRTVFWVVVVPLVARAVQEERHVREAGVVVDDEAVREGWGSASVSSVCVSAAAAGLWEGKQRVGPVPQIHHPLAALILRDPQLRTLFQRVPVHDVHVPLPVRQDALEPGDVVAFLADDHERVASLCGRVGGGRHRIVAVAVNASVVRLCDPVLREGGRAVGAAGERAPDGNADGAEQGGSQEPADCSALDVRRHAGGRVRCIVRGGRARCSILDADLGRPGRLSDAAAFAETNRVRAFRLTGDPRS